MTYNLGHPMSLRHSVLEIGETILINLEPQRSESHFHHVAGFTWVFVLLISWLLARTSVGKQFVECLTSNRERRTFRDDTGWRRLIGSLIFIGHFRKSDLYLMSLLWKMICNLGDPMSLDHPVPRLREPKHVDSSGYTRSKLNMNSIKVFESLPATPRQSGPGSDQNFSCICSYVYVYVYPYLYMYEYLYLYLYV